MEQNIGEYSVANAIVDHEIAVVAAERAAAIPTSSSALRKALAQPTTTEMLGQYGDVYEVNPSGLSIAMTTEIATK